MRQSISHYEEITYNGVTTKRQYIGDAIINETVGGNDAGSKIGFVHRDRLNSVVTITDHNGNVVDNKSFDAFGKPRAGTMAADLLSTLKGVADSGVNNIGSYELHTQRGFTDHEHLDDAELIHMNGRVYDYNLGRFLSVDPFIQSPGNSQSMNPYSYIMNNPLAGTDPSGYIAISGTIIAAIAIYSAWETGDAVGTGIYEVASGRKSVGDAAVDVAKNIVIDKAMTMTGTKIVKMVPDSITKPLVDKAKQLMGNGKDSSMKSDGDASDIGSKPNSDQGMVDNLVNQRRDTGASGKATLGQGRDGDGNLTPVRESIPGDTPAGDIHAETQVISDLRGAPKPHTVAVDQAPCSSCSSNLVKNDVNKVIVPQDVKNPQRAVKNSAVKASQGKTTVKPREITKEELERK